MTPSASLLLLPMLLLLFIVACSVIRNGAPGHSQKQNRADWEETNRGTSDGITRHRNLLFNRFFVVKRRKRQRYLCENFSFSQGCICRENDLVKAIARNKKVQICHDTTIKVNNEIDVTGRSFAISCAVVQYDDSDDRFGKDEIPVPNCTLRSGGKNRIFSGSPIAANFTDLEFRNGSAVVDGDGGIARFTGGTILFHNCDFSYIHASGNGGAIQIAAGQSVIQLCSFMSNMAAGDGGAISLTAGRHALYSNIFTSNSASLNGGAISVTGYATSVTGYSNFYSNAASNGGAMHTAVGASITLQLSSFEGNRATNAGGAIYVAHSNVNIAGGSFTNNVVSESRSSIWIADDDDPRGTGSYVTCGAYVFLCGASEYASNTSGIAGYDGNLSSIQRFRNNACATPAWC